MRHLSVLLSDLYNGDKFQTDEVIRSLRSTCRAPHPLHGVAYSDGVVLCGRGGCGPCREYRRGGRR